MPRSIQIGPRFGAAIGTGGSSDPLAGVTRDAASGQYFPSTIAEWTTFSAHHFTATANYPSASFIPFAIYNLQDASGNPVDASGNGFTLTASGTGLSYQQSVTGYSRKAITTTAAGSGLLQSTAAGLPDISAESQLAITVCRVTTQAVANRDVCSIGAPTAHVKALTVTTTGVGRVFCNANQASGAVDEGGVVQPWCLQIDQTANTAALFTLASKVVPVFAATATGKGIQLGHVGSNDAVVAYLARYDFRGSVAEITATQMKAVLIALGHPATFTP